MATRAEYTTVDAVRRVGLGTESTIRDEMILDIIRAVSREIDGIAGHTFYPRIETRYYDVPRRDLYLDDDLLSLTTLTNGDGTAFTAAQYKLYPLNTYPKDMIRILASSSEQWETDSSGDSEGVISVDGVWGCHEDYDSAWAVTSATVTTAATTTVTTMGVTAGKIVAGELLKVGDEYLHVDSILQGNVDVLTVERAVNGSTATAHTTSAVVYRWDYPAIEKIARDATVAYWRLRNNPVGEIVVVGGEQFSTPKDVSKYIESRINAMGLMRFSFG